MKRLAGIMVALVLPAAATATPPPPRERGEARCESAHWKPKAVLTPISPDGVDFLAIKHLAATMPEQARRSMFLGLMVCDPTAAQAIAVTKMESLLVPLLDLLDPKNNFSDGEVVPSPRYARFRVQVVLALNALNPETDYSSYLIPLLADPDPDVRLHAAIGARNFRTGGVRLPLLRAVIDRVRRDGDPLVRKHAADCALDIGNAVPPRLDAHRELAPLIAAPPAGKNTPQDFSRFARAAQMIERLIATRNRPGG